MEMELVNEIIQLKKKKEKFSSGDIESMKGFIKYCVSDENGGGDDVTKHTLQLLFIFLQKLP